MGAKQCNKFSLLPEEDVLPLSEYLLCGRGQLCEKLHGMMHTYIQDHRRVSKSFLLPWMSDCQDRPSHFHLIQILIPSITSKNFIADMFLIKEGIPSWSIPDTSNHSSVRQQSEGKVNFILAQRILTYHNANTQCTCMNVCVCLYPCVCMLIAHVDEVACRLFFLLLCILLLFYSEASYSIFCIMEFAVAIAVLEVGHRNM